MTTRLRHSLPLLLTGMLVLTAATSEGLAQGESAGSAGPSCSTRTTFRRFPIRLPASTPSAKASRTANWRW